MTDIDIVNELRRLYAAAPQGKWEYSGPFDDGDEAGWIETRDRNGDVWPVVGIGIDRPEAIDLIVAMHEALPALLDAVEAARVYRQSEVALEDEFCEPHFRDKRWLAAMAKRLEDREELDNALAALERSDEG